MKKRLKRLIGKILNIFDHTKKIGERLFKILVQSAVVCCPVILMLAIINTILGVNIRFSYYLIMATLLTLGSSLILCMFRWEQIISKPVKTSKRTVPTKTDRKTQRAIQRKRRRIS